MAVLAFTNRCVISLPPVLDELRRIEAGDGVNDELLDLIEMMTDIMGGMKEADTHE